MAVEYIYCQFPCCIAQTRFVITTFAFLAIVIGYSQRVAFHLAIVEIVDHAVVNTTCPVRKRESTAKEHIDGNRVKWSEVDEGYTLGAFYIGYLITHIPAGIFCDSFGPRYPLITGLLLSSIATLLIPVGAFVIVDPWIVVLLRFITGLGQGALFPAVSSLVTRWIPPFERSTVSAVVFAGNSVGIVLGYCTTGLLLHALQKWQIAFYIWAGIGALFCILFIVYLFSDPKTHPYIHPSELEYLKATMILKQDLPTPYKLIFSDKCVYGLILMHMGHNLLLFTLINNFPKYLSQVLGLNLLENSLVGLLFLLQWVASFFGGILAGYLIKGQNMNVTLLRKAYTFISNTGAFVFICIGVLSECHLKYVITCFAVAIFFKGFYYSGGLVNVLDISEHHSGFIMSVVNTVGSVMGFVSSLIIGIFASHNTFDEWQIIVGIIGIFVVTTLVLYSVLSNAKRRSWDYADNEQNDAAPTPRKKHWYNQLSASAHKLRLSEEHRAYEEMKETGRAAKAKMKQDFKHRT